MATLVAGAVIAGLKIGPVGSAVITGVAAYADFRLSQHLTKVTPPDGERIHDMQIQGLKEGSPSNRLMGRSIRVAGTVLWMPPTFETKDRQDNGKGGGSNGSYKIYSTIGHVLIELARTDGEEILGVDALLTNGKPFFDARPNISFTSTEINVKLEPQRGPWTQTVIRLGFPQSLSNSPENFFSPGAELTMSGWTDPPHELAGRLTFAVALSNTKGTAQLTEASAQITSTIAGKLRAGDSFDLGLGVKHYISKDVEFKGLSDTQTVLFMPDVSTTEPIGTSLLNVSSEATKNNTTVRVINVGFDGNQGYGMEGDVFVRCVAVDPEAYGGAESVFPFGSRDAGDSVTLFQNRPVFSTSIAKAVRYQLGSSSQAPDPLMVDYEEARVGVGNVQSFPNRATVMVEGLVTSDFGNFLAQFEAIVRIKDDNRVSTMLSDYLTKVVGLGDAEFDVQAIPDSRVLEGAATRGVQRAGSSVANIVIASTVLPVDRGTYIAFLDKANLETVAIDAADLGASPSAGSRSPYPFQVLQEADSESIDRIWVEFFDPDNDFQTGSVPARNPGPIRDEGALKLSVAMERTQATQYAEQGLDVANDSSVRVKFWLPSSYSFPAVGRIAVEPGVVAQLGTHFDRDWDVLVDQVDEGLNGILICQGDEYDAESYVQDKVGMVSGSR